MVPRTKEEIEKLIDGYINDDIAARIEAKHDSEIDAPRQYVSSKAPKTGQIMKAVS